MQIVKCHPLLDHNNAFDVNVMRAEDGGNYIFTGTTMKQAALHAVGRCDIRFTDKIKRSDFMDAEQYDVFIRRARLLGLI